MPPIASVTQVGSPLKSASYSGVRRKRTMRSLITKSSMSSCAPLLGERPGVEVALQVDVEEGRDPAQAHGRAVLLLDRAEVGQVEPLDRLVRASRPGGAGRSRACRRARSARRSARICSVSSSRSRMISSQLTADRRAGA